MSKKLTKGSQRMIAGVCSGIAEYFDTDPTLIRILFVLFALALGSGLLFYIILAIIIPSKEY
ncbi:MAG: PspC domain-containing protein [Bacteroidales bacterium]|jgi:phage shock protein PspC (stress-responsive transcriptional regulator)|nr:PspC domain-containing protein [Bacteroidales bacterium]NLM93165.1 PspC domain-containing protein [Bacteroidales bacterium]